MPRLPKTTALKASVDSTDMINAVMNDIDPEATLPRAVRNDVKSIHTIGNIMNQDIELSNSFMNSLFNRIIRTYVQHLYFTNPLKMFKRGYLEAGELVEEIALTLCEPHMFDSTEDGAFPKQEIPDSYTAIHKINYQKYYKRTVNRPKLLRAFVSYSGMEDFVNYIISTLYVTAEVDEYVTMKYVLGRCILNGYITMVDINGDPETEAGAKEIIRKVKAASSNMTKVRTAYNYSHVPTKTDKRNQVLIVNSEYDAIFDVDVLAYMFNDERADWAGRKVIIDPYNDDDLERMDKLFAGEDGYVRFTADEVKQLNSIGAFLLDERFWMIFDVLFEANTFYNPEKLYHNYWLHTWKVVSFSTFVNALAFGNIEQTGTPTELEVLGDNNFVDPTLQRSHPNVVTINVKWDGNPDGEAKLEFEKDQGYTLTSNEGNKYTITPASSGSSPIMLICNVTYKGGVKKLKKTIKVI